MRSRYWRTNSREVMRPICIARCICAMVASTTEKLCEVVRACASSGVVLTTVRIEKTKAAAKMVAKRCADFMTSNDKTWPVAGLLFASGFCALVYQIGWLREFRLIFGASTAASAAVLAIFIGGLGAGGIVIGRRVDRSARPLMLYGWMEMAIAIGAAISPLLLQLIRWIYLTA